MNLYGAAIMGKMSKCRLIRTRGLPYIGYTV